METPPAADWCLGFKNIHAERLMELWGFEEHVGSKVGIVPVDLGQLHLVNCGGWRRMVPTVSHLSPMPASGIPQ